MIGVNCGAGLRSGPPPETAGEPPDQQRGDAEADQVEEGRLDPVAEQQWRSDDQGNHRRNRSPLRRPPASRGWLASGVAHRLIGVPDRQSDHRLQVGYDQPARAAPSVAAHVDALAVRPLPESQSVRATAVADGGGRPEPAPVEADPVGYKVRNPCRAWSHVSFRHVLSPATNSCVRSDAMCQLISSLTRFQITDDLHFVRHFQCCFACPIRSRHSLPPPCSRLPLNRLTSCAQLPTTP